MTISGCLATLGEAEEEGKCGGGCGYQEDDGMEEKAVTSYCRLRGGKGIGKR